jgi:hypothetical protein
MLLHRAVVRRAEEVGEVVSRPVEQRDDRRLSRSADEIGIPEEGERETWRGDQRATEVVLSMDVDRMTGR